MIYFLRSLAAMLAVPGAFHTGRMIRYQRDEPQVAEGLMQMFVAGVSTQKVGAATQTLMGISPSSNKALPDLERYPDS